MSLSTMEVQWSVCVCLVLRKWKPAYWGENIVGHIIKFVFLCYKYTAASTCNVNDNKWQPFSDVIL